MDRRSGLLRPLPLHADQEEAWNRTPVGKKQGLRPMLPQFRLSPDLLHHLHRVADEVQTAGNAVLMGVRSSPHHYLSVKVEELKRRTRSGKGLAGEYAVTVGRLEGAESCALDELLRELEKRSGDEPVEPLHLCKTLCCVYKEKANPGLLRIRLMVIYPVLSLQFTPIAPLKVASTPLSVHLLKRSKQSGSFLWGLIALDKGKRAVLLQPTDPHTTRYSMAGIWAANLPSLPSQPSSPYLHPLIWSLSVYYLHLSASFPRVSPDSAHHVFLFLCISNSAARFCEVSSAGETAWGWAEVERRVGTSDAVVIGFGSEEKGRELGREMSTAEVGEQLKAMSSRPKDSKYQVQTLTSRPAQSQVVSPLLSPRSSLDLSPLCPAPRPRRHYGSTGFPRKSAEDALLLGKMRNFPLEPDSQVPRIHYESGSSSSDEESFRRIEQKYLKLLH